MDNATHLDSLTDACRTACSTYCDAADAAWVLCGSQARMILTAAEQAADREVRHLRDLYFAALRRLHAALTA